MITQAGLFEPINGGPVELFSLKETTMRSTRIQLAGVAAGLSMVIAGIGCNEVKKNPRTWGTVGGAVVGAGVGAAVDKDKPVRGAVIGGAVGGAAGNAGGAIYKNNN